MLSTYIPSTSKKSSTNDTGSDRGLCPTNFILWSPLQAPQVPQITMCISASCFSVSTFLFWPPLASSHPVPGALTPLLPGKWLTPPCPQAVAIVLFVLQWLPVCPCNFPT